MCYIYKKNLFLANISETICIMKKSFNQKLLQILFPTNFYIYEHFLFSTVFPENRKDMKIYIYIYGVINLNILG